MDLVLSTLAGLFVLKFARVASITEKSVTFIAGGATYRIPSEHVVLGSLYNSPRIENLDVDGPGVDLFLDGNCSKKSQV
ncbi:hypothetical protein DWB84_17260 [Saccharophagus sp. K07]|jgi:hypothetical protein|uniref:hypothetical protein n=1 Tax=Saccharophagus sp. K07 TaxID=2283636 RepID=UPI001651F4E0|nr:hypothetical protein [Saccharophagus sp. K07]MBC6907190.1 hypothetical protein [Saccharophagus sp. K07]